MQWASAVSEEREVRGAARQAVEALQAELGSAPPDLAFLFSSQAHAGAEERLAELVREQLAPGVLLGCSAHSVIGGGREIEGRPALSLTAARLPGVSVRALGGEGAESAPADPGLAPDPAPHFVLLADPFSCDAEALVAGLDAAFPASAKIGGLASGAQQPGAVALYRNDRVQRSGWVGLALQGDVEVDTVVAQGCRPIGHPLFVTRCRDGLLIELDGRPAADALRALFEAAEARDRELMQTSLFLGLEMRPELSEYRHGDFLVRNLVGADPERGTLAVAAGLHEGQVVQFHLRDARTSAEDLEAQLARYARAGRGGSAPGGALLFSCLGRGAPLYGHPDHDSDALRRHLGPLPLGGFFCNGEIGPVGRRTFLHGYTSAFGIFRPRD
ncbi:MAG: FIST C-terminal domain-containing protein [Myxococcota bacterium]|nr:FIST C-terminal domain-containing protein [Myxococcota bacterium]